jgi:RNA polymerase sigma factor (sigma-70 family)
MAHETLTYILRRLHAWTGARDLSDGELLDRFCRLREDAAFAVLVQRHGPMVLGVCRRVLNHAQQAEDAFQATFLVLVRKAASIRKGASLASWLYGVAQRIAVKARAQAARRRHQERQSVAMPRPEPLDEMTWHEFRAVLDEELARLPEKYRAPVVLCCLEGKTHDQAAQELGWPRTSVSSRLGRARSLLQERLTRRGLSLSAGLLAALLGREAAASNVPALLTIQTVRAASLTAAGQAATGVVSSAALDLAQGVTQSMFLTKAKVVTVLLLALAGLGGVALFPTPGVEVVPAAAAPREQTTKSGKEKGQPQKDDGLYRDVTAEAGVAFTYRNGEEAGHYAILESLGGGVALIDFDGDGMLDIFLVGGGSFVGKDKKKIVGRPCKLYRNLGGFKFKDVTKEAGLDKIDFYTHGCAVADFDCDGWPDLLVTGYGAVALFHNEPVDPRDPKKGRKFVDVTKKAGLQGKIAWATSAAWGDLDGDGFPDLYICQYVDWSWAKHFVPVFGVGQRDIAPPKNFKGLSHRLFRNNGDGTFADVSKEAGLNVPGKKDAGGNQVNLGKGLGVILADFDNDGKPDIYVANDTVDNFLYMNRSRPGRIRLVEVGQETGTAVDDNAVPNGSKGIAVGDFDGSGKASIFVTNYEGENHALYRNGKDGFGFYTQAAGIAAIGQDFVGNGTAFLDMDNDGWEDLVISDGHWMQHPARAKRRQLPVLLHNEDGKRFVPITENGGPYFRTPHLGRGLAVGDLDNDGYPDLVITHLNEPVAVLRNTAGDKAPRNHWLGVELVGKNRRDMAGARVVVEAGGRRWTRFAKGGGSYLSSSDRRLIFGLGKIKKIDRLRVFWPGGKEQQFANLAIDRYVRLVEREPKPR